MGRHYAETQDIESTMIRALERITVLMGAVGGGLFILEGGEADGKLVCHASHGPVDVRGLTIPAGAGIVGRSVANNAPEMVWDAQNDPSFNKDLDKQHNFTTRSILCVPLSVKDERLGALEIINKESGDGLFSKDDLTLLQALAASTALAIHNARMAGELAEKEVMRRELELAGEIQRGLLPPPGGDLDPVCGVNRPARVVSGDFFDYFTLYDGRIAFTLADVSGKGMNAALLMAKSASLFRCLGKEDLRPGRLLQRINAEVCETSLRGMFVTMVAGVYDPATGRVVLANAGHEPPLLHGADGSFTPIGAGAPPVGIPPELTGGGPVGEVVLHLDGGALYVFTDGVTEGYAAGGAELGADGFQGLIRDGVAAGLSPAARIERVAAALADGGRALRDDVTVLVIDDAAAKAGRGAKTRAEARPAEVVSEAPREGVLCVLEVPARPESLILVRRAVEQTAVSCGFSKEQSQDMVLAVDEACQNVVRHAYGGRGDGDMTIDIRRENGDYIILIRDYAAPVDVSKIKPRDLDDVRPGGLGVHFIREVMDAMDHVPPPDGQGNLLRLKKAI
ncbi:MAG: SpoIIE family protein phosphatase [Alphaproteobacteria bacterium]|nr:SpoIIE family protein phosphatase [Alphaproteobacteria bacterium]MBF0251348.1 SpoIIE family protein phosphatase [Alphaproteobacteria bacterium]